MNIHVSTKTSFSLAQLFPKKNEKGRFVKKLAFAIKKWFASVLSCHWEEEQGPWA